MRIDQRGPVAQASACAVLIFPDPKNAQTEVCATKNRFAFWLCRILFNCNEIQLRSHSERHRKSYHDCKFTTAMRPDSPLRFTRATTAPAFPSHSVRAKTFSIHPRSETGDRRKPASIR